MADSDPVIGAVTQRGDAPEIALALLDAGADPSNALLVAVMEGQVQIAAAAQARGASLDVAPGGTSLLRLAASEGRTAIVEWLLNRGAALEEGDAVAALDQGHVDTAARLLDRGAPP